MHCTFFRHGRAGTHANRLLGEDGRWLARLPTNPNFGHTVVVVEKVRPSWIHFLDQSNLPKTMPFFQLAFALYSIGHRGIRLVINEMLYSVLFREAVERPCMMLPHSRMQIARNTYVECPIALTRQHVNHRNFLWSKVHGITTTVDLLGWPPARP